MKIDKAKFETHKNYHLSINVSLFANISEIGNDRQFCCKKIVKIC